MKKNLRLLCLGLAAATFTCSFAQEDKTSLLKNADMELGAKGWSFDGTDVVGKNTKNVATDKVGFHGMNNGVLEAWHSNAANPLGASYVMQRLKDLPSGTYVFGAYAAAARQYNRADICERDAEGQHVLVDDKHQYSEYWSNRDSICGVSLFANDAEVRVAADNPDLGGTFQWAHSSKFNVAVTLTDEDVRKGYLDVGMRVSDTTNANYVVLDNATLYYFGDMSEAEALDAMAKIDMAAAVAIADTLVEGYVMQVDTLANLQAAIAAAKEGKTTAATLWAENENLFWNMGLARKSIADYENLKKNIESATVVLGGEWSDDAEADVEFLTEELAAAEEAYATKELDRKSLTELRKRLDWAAGYVKIDSVYVVRDYLSAYIAEAEKKVGEDGGYSRIQITSMEDLLSEVYDTLAAYETEVLENEVEFEERVVNPNGIAAYIATVYNTIKSIEDNPVSMEATQMPIVFTFGEDNVWLDGSTWYDESLKIRMYASPVYRFEGNIETFRITVHENSNTNTADKFFCISELKFFDGNGNLIPLTEENISSNADHNALNSTPDGGGFAAMFDDNTNTYFHSAWQNAPSADPYLEITLPNGGYSSFSFAMYSRDNTNGWNQSHTFPGRMTLSTPMPNREQLLSTLAEAQGLNAYSIPEVGFYKTAFTNLLNKIAEVEAALEGYPSEDKCYEMHKALTKEIQLFRENEEKEIYLPEAGKQYRLISGFNGYYEKQSVEKALTVHAADTTLWWENVCADSLQQVFEFEPINPDEFGFPSVKIESGENTDGSTWTSVYYCYKMKNVKTGLYVDSAFKDNKLHLVEEVADTVMLYSLGRGQWNVIVKGSVLHNGDHNSGNASESKGAYGGIAGISSGICAYDGGLDGASAWFIREYPAMPYTVEASGDKFKSECIHFASANTITLTADKDCAFADLALYDLYGNSIEIDSLVVSGKTATITATTKNLVGCAFEFTNAEGVASVEFNAFQYTAAISVLQDAYDAAVAVAPVQGAGVMEYADITEYTNALAEAEAMLEGGAPSDEEIEAMVEKLEKAVAALEPNMPEAGKYYYIYNGLPAFEETHSYKMAMYAKESKAFWAQENDCEWNRYWQFEPATEEELQAIFGTDTKEASEKVAKNLGKAFYIKNVATNQYLGKADGQSTHLDMVEGKASTKPYTFTALEGSVVAIATVDNAVFRLHGAGHNGGANKSGTVVYWNSGLGTASMWTVSEADYDVTDIDFTEVENDAKVSAKGTFDLFGRRVVAPTAPGIYIIDGKKKYVK